MKILELDTNRNRISAKGYESENHAACAVDDYLYSLGNEYGRSSSADYDDQNDTFYFRVVDEV